MLPAEKIRPHKECVSRLVRVQLIRERKNAGLLKTNAIWKSSVTQ
jgi:hypothetical protein